MATWGKWMYSLGKFLTGNNKKMRRWEDNKMSLKHSLNIFVWLLYLRHCASHHRHKNIFGLSDCVKPWGKFLSWFIRLRSRFQIKHTHTHTHTKPMYSCLHVLSLKNWWCRLSSCQYQIRIPRLLHPWDSPGKNTGVVCHFLLQGIFPTHELNLCLLCLLHCRQILYHWATKQVQNTEDWE